MTIQLVASTMLAKFKEILEVRANSSDNTVRKHLSAGKKNAMYTFKTMQNDLLECMIPTDHCLDSYRPLSGIQIIEVTDSANKCIMHPSLPPLTEIFGSVPFILDILTFMYC